jgi:DNA-binding CsgD family transcriptional regulator
MYIPGVTLSPREIEVAQLISQGMTNKNISDKLGISIGMVKNHIHDLNIKLKTTNRTEIARIIFQAENKIAPQSEKEKEA